MTAAAKEESLILALRIKGSRCLYFNNADLAISFKSFGT
jgi:hypothetical protein